MIQRYNTFSAYVYSSANKIKYFDIFFLIDTFNYKLTILGIYVNFCIIDIIYSGWIFY